MRGIVYNALNKVMEKMVGPAFRSFGQKMYLKGTEIEGLNASEDRIVPSLRNLSH
jgi:hypothetical protein